MIEVAAVTALISPESQYKGCQMLMISIRCVVPQATMKIAKQINIQSKDKSFLFLTK